MLTQQLSRHQELASVRAFVQPCVDHVPKETTVFFPYPRLPEGKTSLQEVELEDIGLIKVTYLQYLLGFLQVFLYISEFSHDCPMTFAIKLHF